MTDQIDPNAAAQTVGEEQTPQANSPQAEEPTTEVQTTQQPAVVEGEQDEFPGGTEEQRKAFQEMRQEIKRLKGERETRKQNESAFNAFRPNPGVFNAQVVPNQFIDPITGETNWVAYNQAKEVEIQQKANASAQQTAQELIDENNARNKYPDLFKDSDVEEEIAAKWLWAKTNGRNDSITDIADRVAKRYQKVATRAEKSGAEKVLTEVGEKEQAGMGVQSQTSAGSRANVGAADREALIQTTRRGGESADSAVAERLKAIPWANK